MQYVSREGNSIVFRSNGETIAVTPWGTDSVRVRAVQMQEIRDDRFALLDARVNENELEICLEERRVTGTRSRCLRWRANTSAASCPST